MFQMEIYLVQTTVKDPSLAKVSSTENKKHVLKWMAEFLVFLITTRRTRILTSVLSRNPYIIGHIQ